MQYRRRSGYFGFISDSEPGMASLLIWLSVWRTPVRGFRRFWTASMELCVRVFRMSRWVVAGLSFRRRSGQAGCSSRTVAADGQRRTLAPDVRICRVSNVRNVWGEAKTPLPQHRHTPTRQRERAQSRMIRSHGDVQIQKPPQRNRDLVNLIDRRSFRIGGN